MRTGFAIVLALTCVSTAFADVTLTAKRVDPGTVDLVWTSGTTYYQVYRA
jgi:hypothetical protein